MRSKQVGSRGLGTQLEKDKSLNDRNLYSISISDGKQETVCQREHSTLNYLH